MQDTPSLRRRTRRLWVGGAVVMTAALIPAVQAAGSPPTDAPDGPWSVAKVTGGYQVTLHLSEPLPVRDALPELAADGKSLGLAKQSADGSTLTLVTTDLSAAKAGKIELAWNGQPETAAGTTPMPKESADGPRPRLGAGGDFGTGLAPAGSILLSGCGGSPGRPTKSPDRASAR